MFWGTWGSCGTLGWALQAGGPWMGVGRTGRRRGHCPSWRSSCSLVRRVLSGLIFQWPSSSFRSESLLSALSGQEGAHLAHHPLPLYPRESKSGHFSAQWSICSSTTPSSDSFSSPVFWRILPHFGPVAPPPPCISWLGVLAPFPFPSGPLWAPETRFGRGWAHWVGCIRWSCCLEWEEERPRLDGRGRWTEQAQVWLDEPGAAERRLLGGLNCGSQVLSENRGKSVGHQGNVGTCKFPALELSSDYEEMDAQCWPFDFTKPSVTLSSKTAEGSKPSSTSLTIIWLQCTELHVLAHELMFWILQLTVLTAAVLPLWVAGAAAGGGGGRRRCPAGRRALRLV